jgi:hypothetical protein
MKMIFYCDIYKKEGTILKALQIFFVITEAALLYIGINNHREQSCVCMRKEKEGPVRSK